MKTQKWWIGIAIVALGIFGICDVGGNKSSGVKVTPGGSCEVEGQSGSYDRWWYTCKNKDGQLIWVKNAKNEIGG